MESERVDLYLTDLLGRKLIQIYKGKADSKTRYEVNMNSINAPGVYMIFIETNGLKFATKIIKN